MEFVALCTLAVVIARYVNKRSNLISFSYSVLFALIFVLSLFTTQINFIQQIMQWLWGEEFYGQIREALITPCIWIYSAGAAAAIIELITAAVFAIIAANKAVKKISRIVNDFYRNVNTKEYGKEFSTKNIFSQRKLFLKCCRLLN